MHSRIATLLIILLATTACQDDFTTTSEAEIKRDYPKASMFRSSHPCVRKGRPYFPFILDKGSLLGIGYSRPVVNPDNPKGPTMALGVGRWTYFYDRHGEEGPRLALGEKKDNERSGKWKFWHRNGQPRAEGSFIEGQMHGPWQVWKDDGSIDPKFHGDYVKGQRLDGKAEKSKDSQPK